MSIDKSSNELSEEISKLSISKQQPNQIEEKSFEFNKKIKIQCNYIPSVSEIWYIDESSLVKMKNFFEIKASKDMFSYEEIINIVLSKSTTYGILEAMLSILGLLSEKNSFLLTKQGKSHKLNEYSSSNDYFYYIKDNLDYIFSSFKSVDLPSFNQLLKEIGIDILSEINKHLYTLIRNHIWNNEKVLLLLTGNGFTWIRSERTCLMNVFYDKEINKYTKIFWNNKFFKENIEKITNHPKIKLGFISSMIRNNLNTTVDSICLNYHIKFSDLLCIDQESHNKDEIVMDKYVSSKKKGFREPKKYNYFRSLEMICKYSGFNEGRVLILECERDKSNEFSNCENNSLYTKYHFNENYYYETIENQKQIDEYYSKLIGDVIEMIEECNDDIRIQISKYKVKS